MSTLPSSPGLTKENLSKAQRRIIRLMVDGVITVSEPKPLLIQLHSADGRRHLPLPLFEALMDMEPDLIRISETLFYVTTYVLTEDGATIAKTITEADL